MRQVLVKFQDERFGRVGLTVTTITSLETSISDKFKGEWFGKVGFKVTTSISLEENILDKFEDERFGKVYRFGKDNDY